MKLDEQINFYADQPPVSANPKVTKASVNILLVEGNQGDRVLIERAFELGGTANKIHSVKNGDEARAFLRRTKPFKSMVKPDLIILDIEFNRDGSLDLLNDLKDNPQFSRIPIVALTHSADSQEITESYQNNVNCLIKKPIQVREFLTIIKAIDYFWTEIVTLPHDEAIDEPVQSVNGIGSLAPQKTNSTDSK